MDDRWRRTRVRSCPICSDRPSSVCDRLQRDPEASAIFLLRGNLSCSDCHVNWFCLTEPDLQHYQDVNFSLWLWRIQVWLPITASSFCASLGADAHSEGVFTPCFPHVGILYAKTTNHMWTPVIHMWRCDITCGNFIHLWKMWQLANTWENVEFICEEANSVLLYILDCYSIITCWRNLFTSEESQLHVKMWCEANFTQFNSHVLCPHVENRIHIVRRRKSRMTVCSSHVKI